MSEYVPAPPDLTETIRILKLVSSEEIIAVFSADRDYVYVSAVRTVHLGALNGKWLTGMNVNRELVNHPIDKDHILAHVLEEDIQPHLLRKYREQVGLAAGSKA